mmetsp:Transcript_44927/g.140451  ORF Transcript_44927/g.140451 Transcript_44927/m.140451 type:complete len:363 (+) Transcript_44927:4-1092(+)
MEPCRFPQRAPRGGGLRGSASHSRGPSDPAHDGRRGGRRAAPVIKKFDLFDHFEDAPNGGTIFDGIPHGWGQRIAASATAGATSGSETGTASTEVLPIDPLSCPMVEEWLSSLRPSPAQLQAGADFIGSAELKANPECLMRCVGEVSASKMLGDKAGPPPGEDEAADSAWMFLANNLQLFAQGADEMVAAAPEDRKEDVETLLAKLFTPRGILFHLRGLARELWRAAREAPQPAGGSAMDVDAGGGSINWSACWAWDRHIGKEPFSEVGIVGDTLLSAVAMLIRRGLLETWRETVCPIDQHRDYFEEGGTVKWVSIHPCMHWACARCAKKWKAWCRERREGRFTCPVCNGEIAFTMPAFRPE